MNFSEAFALLEQRGMKYGITLDDMLSKTPPSCRDNPIDIIEFWDNKEISHILPVSTHPHLAGDPSNWLPEDPESNRARGANPITNEELIQISNDNMQDSYDYDYDDNGVIDLLE